MRREAWLDVCFCFDRPRAVIRCRVTPPQLGCRWQKKGMRGGGGERVGRRGSDGRGDDRETLETLSFHDLSPPSRHAFCSPWFVASHPSPPVPSALPPARSSLFSLGFHRPLSSRASCYALSFPTLLPPYSPVLKCPLPPSPLLCLRLDLIQTHRPILFQDTTLPPLPPSYLFPPVPDWIVIIPPKWISVLTIQRLGWIYKVEFLKSSSRKWIIMHRTQLEFIKW